MGLKAVAMLHCSFCGKTAKEVYKLIAGPASYICDDCVGLCAEIIAESRAHDRITEAGKLLVTAEEAASLAWMKTWTTSKPLAQQPKAHGGGDGDRT